MKIRIKGNSIRIRLTKPEVSKLADTGRIEEHTFFANNRLVYSLQSIDTGSELSAAYHADTITMFVPKELIKGWQENDVVGFSANMAINKNDNLYLLLEKDFVCLDETNEDQSNNYENPNKTC